jgi:hypothetical protein
MSINFTIDEILTEYWNDNYVNGCHCSLCGNSGIIDSRGRAITGHLDQVIDVGRKNYCICPNGRMMRKNKLGDV